MTELLFQLAGSTLFLILSGFTIALVTAGFLFRGTAGVRLLQIALPFALFGVLLSAPPLPRGSLIIWTVFAFLWWAETEFRSRKGLRLSGPFGGLLAAATLVLVLLELPYLRMPEIASGTTGSVYVVGDSLSAGIGSESHTWPDLLAENTGLTVANLASPGARLGDGPGQIREIGDDPNALIFVLLGGNDLLFRASREDFERDFRELLDGLAETERRVVVFELPIIVGFRHYGRIQRQLARDYDLPLVPSRVLAGVLSTEDGTSDGIHLTDRGHRNLAERVAGLLVIE